jgi:hypothetical protein
VGMCDSASREYPHPTTFMDFFYRMRKGIGNSKRYLMK